MKFRVIESFLLLLVLGTTVSVWAEPCNHPRTNETVCWTSIARLHNDGVALLSQEEQNPKASELRQQREDMFRRAAVELRTYINRYVKERQSIRYLEMAYRLGLYYQLAAEFGSAREWYRRCDEHPKKEALEAQYNGKPICEQLKQRLNELPKSAKSSTVKISSQIVGFLYSPQSSK